MEVEDPNTLTDALKGSTFNFLSKQGVSLVERAARFGKWLRARRGTGTWPYGRVLLTPPGKFASIADEFGSQTGDCINFGSQDYLGLARDPRVFDAAREMIHSFGVHSAGSPALAGRTSCVTELEHRLAKRLGYDASVLFATGWGAGFGVIAGLARRGDTIVIDRLAHNCLMEGAKHAGCEVCYFAHNDLDSLEQVLSRCRESDREGDLFVIAEGLYSMDSDQPDIKAMLSITRRYDAILILDIAHDFGAMGPSGLGALEGLEADRPDVIMGSFSKTFASNGGFIAGSESMIEYLRYYSTPLIFSNAISPLQVAIVGRAFEIVFSDEGNALRGALRMNVDQLRRRMSDRGFGVGGTPSPIVPVSVGEESLARLMSRRIAENGLLANLVEFPAVPMGSARFRFQVMSTHSSEAIERACVIMSESRDQALEDRDRWQACQSQPSSRG